MNDAISSLFHFLTLNITDFIDKIIQIILVLGITYGLYNFSFRLIRKTTEYREIDRRVLRQIRIITKYLVYGMGFLALLGVFGLNITVIATSLGIAGITIGFATRDLFSNLIGGVFLLIDNVYGINDVVSIEENYGIVRLITLRTTQIKTFDGNIIIIPNSNIINSTVINMTNGSNEMIISLSFNIDYKEDINRVKDLLIESIPFNDYDIFTKKDEDILYKVEDIGDDYHGNRITIFLNIYSQRQPWITSKIRERMINKMIKSNIEFHKEATRVTISQK
jgi:small conductance mechanosensitive channel